MDRNRWVPGIAGLGAAVFLIFGLWPFFDARSFFDDAAEFNPYNAHFLHDIGAFQIGIGATLAIALWKRTDAIFAALAGAGIGSAFHTIAHVRDQDLGGRDGDIVLFGVLTLLLLGGAAWRLWPAPPSVSQP